ncbi:MAG: galactosyltransferase-related protein, partial [Parabacteroides sp.]|nr:galactosyltransferase-related protein [Parabacteroides sp.]
YFNKEGKPIPVASIIGADLMVRKSVLLKVGGFSPEFFMNYEETELCNRITRAGFSIYSVPSAQITHLEGRASYIKQSRLYFLYEGQYIYFRKVYGIFGCRLIFAITQLKSYIRLFQFLLLSNKERRSYWRMKLETNREVWHSTKIKHFLI